MIAENVGISASYLSTLFKSSLQISIVDYINSFRIEKAKSLLKETSLPIVKIIEQVGYSNNVTFSRNFKRHVGCIPSEYRDSSKT